MVIYITYVCKSQGEVPIPKLLFCSLILLINIVQSMKRYGLLMIVMIMVSRCDYTEILEDVVSRGGRCRVPANHAVCIYPL